MQFSSSSAGVLAIFSLMCTVSGGASVYSYHRQGPHKGDYQQMHYRREPHRKQYPQTYFRQGHHDTGYQHHTYYAPLPPSPKPTPTPSFPSLIINSNINTNSNNNTDIAAAGAFLLSQLISTQTGSQDQSGITFPLFLKSNGLAGNGSRQGNPNEAIPTLSRQADLLNVTSASFPGSGTIINLNTNSNTNINDLIASLFITIMHLLTNFQASSQTQTLVEK